jgi:transposase
MFCPAVKGMLASPPRTTGYSSRRCFTVIVQAYPGGTCRERFGDPIQVHTRFSRWAKRGVWKKIFEMLAADADNEYAMIDSTIVRAHQHSAGAQKKTAKTRRSGAAKAD